MPEINVPTWARPLFEPRRYKIAHGGRGCLAPGSRVVMADGSLRRIEGVVVGDQLMGPDSSPRTVLRLFRGREMMYRVKQTSAQDYVVNGAHVLVLRKSRSCQLDRGEKMPSGNWRRPRGRYPEYPDEVEISVEDWLKQSKRWKDSFRGFRAGLIRFAAKPVSIDPYLLGLWLGDGLHRELMITSADHEIKDWLRDHADACGLRYTESAKYGAGNAAVDVRLGRNPEIHGRENPVWQAFKRYNVVSNKHIPEDYIVNSEQVRLSLLAGLIDSDGTYSRGGYDIALANERLARDVKRLADSLGFRTSLRHRTTACSGFKGEAWRIGINGDTDRIPCRVERKKATVSPKKDKMLSMISVERVGEGDYYGVLLDGDHRFILEDGTVTHNSGKSWAFAMALLILGAQRPLRVLCAREIQKSLKESVHQLLTDQIVAMGLEHQYDVLDTEIRGRNGTQFTFAGLQQHTVSSVKSYEGVDVVWVEEAQTVSKKSWDILIPTIRRPGSEIWITFNPLLDTDETWKRFVESPPPNAWVCQVNFTDNPWFPPELEQERLHCQITDPDGYKNIWEGVCRATVEGAIYASEVSQAVLDGRITRVPYSPQIKVHTVWDLGWNDATSIAFVQKVGPSALAIIDYIEDSHRTLDSYAREVRERSYNFGSHWVPHDGTHKDLKTGQSVQQMLGRMLGSRRPPEVIPNIGIEPGIRLARMALGRAYFDQKRTARLVECLKRYRRAINAQTNEPGAPVHDEYSHGADAWRYVGVVAEKLTNEDEMPAGPPPEALIPQFDSVAGY